MGFPSFLVNYLYLLSETDFISRKINEIIFLKKFNTVYWLMVNSFSGE